MSYRRPRVYLQGLGQETPPSPGLKTAVAVGALGLLGLGLWYGLTEVSYTGARRYRWGGS